MAIEKGGSGQDGLGSHLSSDPSRLCNGKQTDFSPHSVLSSVKQGRKRSPFITRARIKQISSNAALRLASDLAPIASTQVMGSVPPQEKRLEKWGKRSCCQRQIEILFLQMSSGKTQRHLNVWPDSAVVTSNNAQPWEGEEKGRAGVSRKKA